MLREGIRLYEYRHAILHDKSMAVRGRVAIIGSANFDLLSILMNWEQVLVIDDVGIVGK